MSKKTKLFGLIIVAVVALLLMPNTVNAKSCEQAIAGLGGEDSGTGDKEAIHPQDDAQGQYIHTVYARETNQPDPLGGGMIWGIRLAISFNWGVSWSYFEWVDLREDVQQDYPDVDIYYDYPDDEWKVIVVWQERPIAGGPWSIKMKVRSGLSAGGGWSSTMPVSQAGDQYDNIYPKVAGCSIMGLGLPYQNPPDDPDSWRNVVWQRYYLSTGTFGVKLRVCSYLNGWAAIHDIGVPQVSNEEYKHPAVSCNTYGDGRSGWEDVHIVYQHILPTGDWRDIHRIEYQGGRISWNSNVYPTPPTYGPFTIATTTRYGYIGYPDICAYGVASASGEVHIVWMQNFRVYYRRNNQGGNSPGWLPLEMVSPNGGPGSLRCVALKVMYSQCSVVWTANAEVYFDKQNKIGGSWPTWSNQFPEEQWTTNGFIDDFVDVSISGNANPPAIPVTIYSHVVWQRSSVTVWYARDP